ncbi:MAG: hypothetical protein AAFQ52_07755 [Chloroflexota bacterium]
MTQKAKSKHLAFASEMQDWISEERWSERLVGMLCVMAGLLNILIVLNWSWTNIIYGLYGFWIGMALLGVYLWLRTSTPQKIQARLRQRLHKTPFYYVVGGSITLGITILILTFTHSLSFWWFFSAISVRSLAGILGAFGIQTLWRGWKLSQMQAYYGV